MRVRQTGQTETNTILGEILRHFQRGSKVLLVTAGLHVLPQEDDAELQEAYEAYFAKGGKVTVCTPDTRTEGATTNPWQRSKKKTEKK